MKTHWNDLAKARMKELGITQEQLAEKLGKTQGGVGHWLNNRRQPSVSDISDILKALDMKPLTITSDGNCYLQDEEHENVVPAILLNQRQEQSFPVISAVAAGAWTEAMEPYALHEIDEYLSTTEKASQHSFWLKVVGDSMTAPSGLSFPDGMYILVDTEVEPVNQKFVVAKLKSVNEATFKQLVIDAGQKFLKPLNPEFKQIAINGDCKIVGVIIDAKWKLR